SYPPPRLPAPSSSFTQPASPEISTLSLHDALPISLDGDARDQRDHGAVPVEGDRAAFLRVPHARPRLRQCRRPPDDARPALRLRSEEHTSELQSRENLVCRLLLEKKNDKQAPEHA